MIEQTYGNYVRHGFGPDWTLTRQSPEHEFNVRYGPCTQQPGPYRDELIRAATLVRQSTQEPLYMWLSGGVDSHIAAWAFVAAEIPIQVLMMRMKDDLNLHDIAHGIVFCERHGIPYRFLDIDYLEFAATEYDRIATTYNSFSPSFCALIHLVEKIDNGCHIFSANEPKIVKNGGGHTRQKKRIYQNYPWSLMEAERLYALQRYFQSVARPAVPGFLHYTPELTYSFLTHPIISELRDNQHFPITNSTNIKDRIYDDAAGGIYNRPKYHGYEKVFDRASPKWFETRDKTSNVCIFFEIDEVLEWLRPVEATSSQ